MRGWKDAGLPTTKAAPPALAERGQLLYTTQCAVCHQTDGLGLTGNFPPLDRDAAVNNPDPTAMTSIVLFGGKGGKIGGKSYSGTMPPFGVSLQRDEIAAVETYVRTHWHNHAPPVSVDDVAKVQGAAPSWAQKGQASHAP